ncbi:protein ROS1A-like [Trifolium pratense]|uniref:protein ROS1A-like n=1 Tax=Trifolium pratense TaxID=57577 RepID=UPI001E69037E|nr:protein ROS1A-like [Trifolium pratense]
MISPSTPMAIPFNDSSPVSENDDDTVSCCNEDLSDHADQVFDVLHQCEDVELCPPSFSKKRNNSQKDVNDELQKPVKRTKYRPKVVSQVAKRTKKSQPESNNTPKPATPKQRKTYVRRKTPKCQRPLFVDEDSISFSFLENFNNSKVDQHEIENSTITNESAIGYNSLQSYQKMTSLSCLTLIESRRVGVNFPITCKRKRVRRQKIQLVKLLTPFAKGKRSTTFIRKRKCWTHFCVDGMSKTSRKMKSLIKRIVSLKKQKRPKPNKLVARKKSGELVLYNKKSRVDVILDEETLRVSNLLLAERGHHEPNQSDEQKRYWKETRDFYQERFNMFLYRMRYIQGDRRFTPWKGSVLDSVVGVFLTQNVSDHLSSNAFMSLAVKYPLKSVSCEQSNNLFLSAPKFDTDLNDREVEESEAQEAIESSKVDSETENNSCPMERRNSDYSEVSCERSNDEEIETQKANKSSKVDERNSDSSEVSCERSNIEDTETQRAKSSKVDGMERNSDSSEVSCERSNIDDTETQKANKSSKADGMERNSDSLGMNFGMKQTPDTKKSKKEEREEENRILLEKKRQNWAELRKKNTKSHRHRDHEDSIDYEAVRTAKLVDVAAAIKIRGQHTIIGGKIKAMLNKIRDSDGRMDLEWLRNIEPKEVKEFLLDIYGLGLKSVECIRLLALNHVAFPVDVNVARIVVRLGWVPLQPLPGYIQIHNLEIFPDSNKIQQFLWPRLCTLDHETLYELHYQLITFGKVFCTKRNPNCNACPMSDVCEHYKSSLARTKLALPPNRNSDQTIVATETDHANAYSDLLSNSKSTFITEDRKECEPIVEMPASPEPEDIDLDSELDEEIYYGHTNEDKDIEDIMTVNLSSQESSFLSKILDNSFEEFDYGMNTSSTMVLSQAAAIPSQKMKNVSRLKTERLVYVLPDKHPLLAKCAPREPNDRSPYLLIVWLPAELGSSDETSKTGLQEEENIQSQTVPGTLLIPCRTAMRARFPLNGTYFQTNEVFADYASMKQPINVPRNWIWNLERRITYFGTSFSSITRGLSMEQIKNLCWEGFICVRAIDTITGAPRPISSILHRNTTTKVGKGNKNVLPNES